MTATMTRRTELSRTTTSAGSVWRTGALAAVVGAVALGAYGAAAQALSVPMKAQAFGTHSVATITPGNFAFGVVFCTVIATALAVILNRSAAHPARAFLRTTLVLTVASFSSPLAATHIAISTRVTLLLGHALAAAIVIPLITRRLPRQR